MCSVDTDIDLLIVRLSVLRIHRHSVITFSDDCDQFRVTPSGVARRRGPMGSVVAMTGSWRWTRDQLFTTQPDPSHTTFLCDIIR